MMFCVSGSNPTVTVHPLFASHERVIARSAQQVQALCARFPVYAAAALARPAQAA